MLARTSANYPTRASFNQRSVDKWSEKVLGESGVCIAYCAIANRGAMSLKGRL
jgi:hypothetical protein